MLQVNNAVTQQKLKSFQINDLKTTFSSGKAMKSICYTT